MSVIIDNVSCHPGDNVTAIQGNHTCGAGTTLLMACAAIDRHTSQRTVTGVFYNGVPLTLLIGRIYDLGHATIYYMLNPPIGTYTLEVQFNGLSAIIMVGGISFLGAAAPVGAQSLTFAQTAWSLTPNYDANGYYLASLQADQHSTGWYGSTARSAGQALFCHDYNTNYERQVMALYQPGSVQTPMSYTSPRVRYGSLCICTIPPLPPAGGSQVIWMT